MMGLAIAALALAAWVYLALGRGGFWRGREDDQALHDALRRAPAALAWPRVVAIVPARDEAELIGSTVASLLAQRYPGLSVVVVDDHSEDGTAAAAARSAAACPERLTVLAAPPLPACWTGKLWAMAHGVAHCEAADEPPEFLLFTDADIAYEPDALSALVFSALEEGSVLLSLMVKLRCESFAERALIPAFVFFFQMLYPFAWVNDRKRRTAAAAGGCMLVRRQALREAGGLVAIRNEIIDDCALGRLLRPRGAIRLALGEHVASLRAYASFGAIGKMIVRSAYAQLGYAWWKLALVAIAMLVVFVAPVVLTLTGAAWTVRLSVAAWLLMGLLFAPMQRRYGVAVGWALALPAIASGYLWWTLESAWQHHRGRGGMWKGRVQGSGVNAP